MSLIKIFENPDFFRKFPKSRIWYEIFKNLDFGPNFRKIWLLAKISKISNLSNFRKLYLFLSFFKISNLVKIMVNLDFFLKIDEKSRFFWNFMKNLKFVPNSRKNFDFGIFIRKISMFVKII